MDLLVIGLSVSLDFTFSLINIYQTDYVIDIHPSEIYTSSLQLNFIRSSLDIYLFRCEENVGLDRWFSRILHELESCPDQQSPIL